MRETLCTISELSLVEELVREGDAGLLVPVTLLVVGESLLAIVVRVRVPILDPVVPVVERNAAVNRDDEAAVFHASPNEVERVSDAGIKVRAASLHQFVCLDEAAALRADSTGRVAGLRVVLGNLDVRQGRVDDVLRLAGVLAQGSLTLPFHLAMIRTYRRTHKGK